jgi:hypothetical protein
VGGRDRRELRSGLFGSDLNILHSCPQEALLNIPSAAKWPLVPIRDRDDVADAGRHMREEQSRQEPMNDVSRLTAEPPSLLDGWLW